MTFVLDFTAPRRTDNEMPRGQIDPRDVIETIPAMAWTVNPDGSDMAVNKRWREYTGIWTDQLDVGVIPSVIHPDDRSGHAAICSRGLETATAFENEIRILRAAESSSVPRSVRESKWRRRQTKKSVESAAHRAIFIAITTPRMGAVSQVESMSSNLISRKLVERTVGGKLLSIETGHLAKQASGSVVVRIGDTMTLVALVAAPGREGLDFFSCR